MRGLGFLKAANRSLFLEPVEHPANPVLRERSNEPDANKNGKYTADNGVNDDLRQTHLGQSENLFHAAQANPLHDSMHHHENEDVDPEIEEERSVSRSRIPRRTFLFRPRG